MKRIKEKLLSIGMLTYFIVTQLSMNVQAQSLQDTKLVQGTINLIADASKVALIIEASLVGLLEIIEGIKYQMADDQEKPKHIKAMKSIGFIGILIMSITGLIAVVFSYYQ